MNTIDIQYEIFGISLRCVNAILSRRNIERHAPENRSSPQDQLIQEVPARSINLLLIETLIQIH